MLHFVEFLVPKVISARLIMVFRVFPKEASVRGKVSGNSQFARKPKRLLRIGLNKDFEQF